MVGAARKARQNIHMLNDIRHYNTNSRKNDHASKAVNHRAMSKCEQDKRDGKRPCVQRCWPDVVK